MFGSQTLDIAMGLVFVYFVLSIICTAAQEMLSALLRLRANNLVEGIENLLKDRGIPSLEKDSYEHPLIKSLYRGEKRPSYIPSGTFGLALLDLVAPAKMDGPRYISDIRATIAKMDPASGIGKTLLIFLEEAENDMQKLRTRIESWFNDSMDRVSGWYKRKAQFLIFIIAAIIVGISNADTIQIARSLSNDPALRQVLSTQVQDYLEQQNTLSSPQPLPSAKESRPAPQSQPPFPKSPDQEKMEAAFERLQKNLQELQNLQEFGIPLGWRTLPRGWNWGQKIVGLLLTLFAVSLGAPFWFDLLNKIVSLRTVGVSPEEKHEKALKHQKESAKP